MLPRATALGILEIVEVFDFYDGPRLFACQNRAQQIYLAMWFDQVGPHDEWLYVAASPSRLADVRCGAISLREAFEHPESGVILKVMTHREKGADAVEVLAPAAFDADDLPDPDDRLALPPPAVAVSIASAIGGHTARPAVSRFEVDLRLEPHQTRSHEVDARAAGGLVIFYQELVEALAQSLAGQPTSRGMIPAKIRRRVGQSLVAMPAGSFVFKFAAGGVDLFGASEVEQCVAELANLLGMGADRVAIRARFDRLGPRAASKYRGFLKWVSEPQGPLTMSYLSPRGSDYDRKIEVPYMTLRAAFRTMEDVEKEIAETKTLVGVMEGFDVKRLTFNLHADDGKRYTGKVIKEAIANQPGVVVPGRYEVKMKVIYEVESMSGAEKRSLFLQDLKRLQ